MTDPAQSYDALSLGSYGWGGAFGALYWVDPVEALIGFIFIQLLGHTQFNVRQRFTDVVTQVVIIDSVADQRSTVQGYAAPQ